MAGRKRPWLCRHGYHKWRFVKQENTRHVDVAGLGRHYICDLTETCERCLITHRIQGAETPRRVKVLNLREAEV